MTTKLLVALHPGFSHTPAVERAKAIAKRSETDVLIYSVVYDQYSAGTRFGDDTVMRETRKAMLEAERSRLAEIEAEFVGVANQVAIRTEWGASAAAAVSAAAERYGADLIVVSSTRHNPIARWLLTNTDWAILQQARRPVLLAHHRPFREYQSILAAVDPTHTHDEPAELDDRIIGAAQRVGAWFGGTVQLGHAYPSQRTVISADYILPVDVAKAWREANERAVRELAARHGIEAQHQQLLDEAPTQAIPDLAKKLSADLVVLGVVSRSHWKQLWIGRTAETILDRVECDVLAVH